MKRKVLAFLIASLIAATLLTGCGNGQTGTKKDVDTKTWSEDDWDDDEDIDDDDDDGKVENTKPEETRDGDDVEITPTENASIVWEEYTTSDGYMICKIPKGWEVKEEPGDIISYQMTIYDPDCPARMVYFCPTASAYKSKEAIDLASKYDYTGADWSKFPINKKCTTASFFENSGQLWGYTDYTEIANLGENGWGGDIIQATCTYQNTECEGLFTCATMLPLGTMYFFNVDIAPTSEYGTDVMIAPAEEFPSWQPVLVEIFSSITMTNDYQKARARAWKQVVGTSEQLAAVANYTSDLIMSGWESRNNTYDILSQRTSDATMGRDRVYDTETGEVYYTEVGWYDHYDGTRFEYIGEGSTLYNLPVTGTIK